LLKADSEVDPVPTGHEDVIAKRAGIILDVGCGASKQPGAVGMDHQALEGVDVVHSWNEFPWPFEDESVLTIVASHVVEHVNPADGHFLRWMNECWRVLKPEGQLAIVTPYAGSAGFWQDPTHCNGCSEATWYYFDPAHASGFWGFYKPQPWQIEVNLFHMNGNLEVVLRKRVEIDE
jgi:SAM-dependent methyltransferase